jgi:predicted dienelactone hydrolase
VEIWYPAQVKAGAAEMVTYESVLGRANDPKRPLIPFTFTGRALREAAPISAEGAFPLVIVSHGYPGSRLLLTYLTENLASKGYVVAAIDHTESTYRDVAGFHSTLLNRPKDILFVLDQIATMGKPKTKSFLSGVVDANNTALIGYSMGGYGVLNVAGAGFSSQLAAFFGSMTGGSRAIEVRTANHAAYQNSVDPRIKAVVAFAPWGMERGVWDAEGLQGLKLPTLLIAGSQDDVSGYEKGVKAIYTGAVNADRYLLTYINARHNVAPNPPPPQSLNPDLLNEYYHYAEPAWNERRINNINQHFVTAFLGVHLKKQDYQKYLQVEEDSGKNTWMGFKPRTSAGLELLHAPASGR